MGRFNKNLMFSSEDNEHYTPVDLLWRICEFYGDLIDLDPCSNSTEYPHTPAYFHYTEEMNGLACPWFGKMFANPPYGRSLKEWARAVVEKRDEYKELLFLVPSRTDTQWYSLLTSFPRLNFRGRLKFHNPKNKGNSAPFPSVLFYVGPHQNRFKTFFEDRGEIIIPSFDKKAYQREYMRKRRASAKKIK